MPAQHGAAIRLLNKGRIALLCTEDGNLHHFTRPHLRELGGHRCAQVQVVPTKAARSPATTSNLQQNFNRMRMLAISPSE